MRLAKLTRGQNQELYIGLVRLPVLHHAAEGPVLGLDVIQNAFAILAFERTGRQIQRD